MNRTHIMKLTVTAAACACALAIAVGCSPAASGSSSASASASADSSASATASEATDSAASAAESAEASASAAGAESGEASSTVAASSSAADAASGEASTASAVSTSAPAQITAENAEASGYQVFEGTIRVLDAEKLIELQGVDIDPAAAGGGGTYAVLVFDQPTDVTGMQADGSGEDTRSATMLGVAEYTDYSSFTVEYGDLEACEALDGQHVTLAAAAQDIMFPSDVRLPIGEPSANTSIVLE